MVDEALQSIELPFEQKTEKASTFIWIFVQFSQAAQHIRNCAADL